MTYNLTSGILPQEIHSMQRAFIFLEYLMKISNISRTNAAQIKATEIDGLKKKEISRCRFPVWSVSYYDPENFIFFFFFHFLLVLFVLLTA